ncbi:MAG: PilN domain-containing protein [Gammaproteobacteria bacterium]|nr:PilN domain-containing protein [Gammaproteobacteria bacterium]
MAMLQAVGLVLIGIVAIYSYTWWQIEALKNERKRVDQSQATATKRLADATEKFNQRSTRTSLDKEIANLENEIVSKQRIQEILQRGIFSNTRGFSDYFVSFARQYVPGVWLTGFDITGAADQLTLSGRTANPELVPRYLQKLATEKTLSGIEFRVFQMNRPAGDAKEADKSYVEFQAKTTVNAGS